MKVSVELSLRTREVYQLFERKMDKDRRFLEALLHKFNILMGGCRRGEASALKIFHQMEQNMLTLTQQFSNEIESFNALLQKQKDFADKKINFIAQFHPSIIVSNPLCMHFVEFIEVYDTLIATLKLLFLAGCFVIDDDYYENIKRIQKLANRMLGNIINTRRPSAVKKAYALLQERF